MLSILKLQTRGSCIKALKFNYNSARNHVEQEQNTPGQLETTNTLRGVSTLRRAVSGEKQNSSRNLKILPGIGRLGKFFQETRSNEVKILGSFIEIFWECLPKIRDDIPDFRDDF